MKTEELNRLTEEFKKDKEVKVRARGIVALSLMIFLLSALVVFAGCKGGGSPVEPSPTIVGTWHNNWSGWRKTFAADGSYSAKLYGSSYNITETGRWYQNDGWLKIEATQYNSGTSCSVGCSRTAVLKIISLSEVELVLEIPTSGFRLTYRRVS